MHLSYILSRAGFHRDPPFICCSSNKYEFQIHSKRYKYYVLFANLVISQINCPVNQHTLFIGRFFFYWDLQINIRIGIIDIFVKCQLWRTSVTWHELHSKFGSGWAEQNASSMKSLDVDVNNTHQIVVVVKPVWVSLLLGGSECCSIVSLLRWTTTTESLCGWVVGSWMTPIIVITLHSIDLYWVELRWELINMALFPGLWITIWF